MGYKIVELKLQTDYQIEELKQAIRKELQIKDFTYSILKQSLDGRQFRNIHWIVRCEVYSVEIKDTQEIDRKKLEISFKKRDKSVVVVGSGPAGFFSAYTLIKAGFAVTLLERGPEVYQRIADVRQFEKNQELNERSNYAFGEGGAGTFSDGKLTSRTKTIELERRFIFDEYAKFGAPEEIKYLSKPHIGSNLLVKTVKNLRKEFINLGGKYIFDNEVTNVYKNGDKITAIESEAGKIEADYFVFATGHSAINTYRMLINNGAKFHLKTFAIGSRVEHTQESINLAFWKQAELPGVKAADYALTYNNAEFPVYSFCMCPGGMVVSAPHKKGVNLVNGMSNYKRNYPFANSAIVAAFNLQDLTGKNLEPLEALDWVADLEKKFFDYTGSYDVPAVKVADLLKNKTTSTFPKSSYAFELKTADFKDLMPAKVLESQKLALTEFSKKIKGWEEGILMGLESRTSSPIQALRNKSGLLDGFDNLYFVGEGSGFSGGIISSGAEGIKAAMDIIAAEE